MKCDGYAPPEPKASRKSKKNTASSQGSTAVVPSPLFMQTIDQTPLLEQPEKVYLQHFLHWTSRQLSSSSAASNFWLEYALPMSYHYDAIRGRYDERLRHLASGDTLLQSLGDPESSQASALTEKIVEIFCQIALEFSDYMNGHALSGIRKWCRKENCRFQTLDEASYALHQLKLNHEFAPWDQRRDDALARDENFEDRLEQWNSEFQALCQRLVNTSEQQIPQINSLQLRYEYLRMYIDVYDNKELNPPQPYMPFLTAAEKVAAPLVAMNQPTFSLDGCLVSGLSFVAISNEDGDIKSQALSLLEKLNHREGIIDSNDIVEMHEMLGLDLGDWGSDSGSDSDSEVGEVDPPLLAPTGIPQMLEPL
ncbi:hypothetical protein FGRMN_5554 [Fusarium graminum]|nr:hypothetical protein FGRMN_5554 [Fusarium graminum]